MNRRRLIGWIVAGSKEEAVKALEKMLDRMKLCDEDVDMVNMNIFRDELNDGEEA